MTDTQREALLDAARAGPVELDGLRVAPVDDGFEVVVDGERHQGLSTEGVLSVAEDYPHHVSNWYVWTEVVPDGPPRTFCRWVERATERSVPARYDALEDGVTREWGQLSITATRSHSGARRYHLRHGTDAGRELSDLRVHADPFAVREIVETDEDGRYRPLKTAPTLRTGWAITDLDATTLVRTVDLVYPATVHNWVRERDGRLDVSHWRATADRQTGIYDLVEDLPREAVGWLAEACCVDSQCLKRREWDYDEETPLSVPAGDGEFPCREPCSLVIAAARQWTLLEREATRTYEFDLTPSEKEQVEAVIDAVADGRTDDIREAAVDDGANRYRTRYLRAKRFDEAGNFCGVATDRED